MQILTIDLGRGDPITRFSSRLAAALPIAKGTGEARLNIVSFAPGGLVGPHPAGPDQLFFVLSGSGWAAGENDVRYALLPGQAAYFPAGKRHSKGSEVGLCALMAQVDTLELARVLHPL